MKDNKRPAIFLDRDGTINVDKDYLYRIEEFEYVDGVIDALKTLLNLGFILVVVTNQSGIARGYYTEEDLAKLNEWMQEDLRKRGVVLSGVYYCPHHPEALIPQYRTKCNCRKPATGLYWQAEKELQIDMSKSFVIGDKIRDLAICEESGVTGILLGKLVNGDADNVYARKNWAEVVSLIELLKED